jgi:hypothetical protein
VSAGENGDTVSPPGPEAGAMGPTQPSTVVSSHPPSEPVAERAPDVDPDAIERIAARARRVVRDRIRAALDGPAAAAPAESAPHKLDVQLLDLIADEEVERAGGPLLHVAVVHAVSQELGIELTAALEHPAVDRARDLLVSDSWAGPPEAGATGDDAWPTLVSAAERSGSLSADDRARTPRQRALLLDAVHVFGIETLEPGDSDVELRLADVGLDVLKPSTDEMIGRLRWNEIRTVALKRPRRGLRGRRRPALFVAGTDQGEVTFELPGVSDEEITAHLEPLITRNCAGQFDPDAG